jgi:hypothetical protein
LLNRKPSGHPEPVPAHDYQALMLRAGHDGQGDVLHLVRARAEASLCGLPRGSLGPAAEDVHAVCGECIEWLKNAKISGPIKTRRGDGA